VPAVFLAGVWAILDCLRRDEEHQGRPTPVPKRVKQVCRRVGCYLAFSKDQWLAKGSLDLINEIQRLACHVHRQAMRAKPADFLQLA